MPATARSPVSVADAQAQPERLQGLPAIASAQTRVLILGSFPGAASLRASQYYAHAQNRFWRIVQALWPQQRLPDAYPARCDWLLARGLGLWDVYASCERAGSLDASIRNPELNDFARLHRLCPQLAALAHNGGESFRCSPAVLAGLHAQRRSPAAGAAPDESPARIQAFRLPSTSPANASWTWERQLAAWSALMSAQRLL